MIKYLEKLTHRLLGTKYSELSDEEKNVIDSIANAEPIAENVNAVFTDQLTLGQRVADKVAAFGGSWPFISLFIAVMVIWMFVNSHLIWADRAFDPYPFILLNLILSTLAALQAPIIMMSQNRQAEKDRLDSKANYEISLKTDLEIIRLHQKIDELKELIYKDNR